jgi:hypothetical protein
MYRFRKEFFEKKEEVSEEDLILSTLKGSHMPLSLESIYDKATTNRYISYSRIKKLISDMCDFEQVQKEIYKVRYSSDPRIDIVVAEVYYTDIEQKDRFEREALPNLINQVEETYE